MNTATDYQTGIEMHFEWELAEHLPFGLATGVGGYLYQQLTGDSGSGAVLGPFIGRVASVGPVLSYTFKSGEQQVTLSARCSRPSTGFPAIRFSRRSVSRFRRASRLRRDIGTSELLVPARNEPLTNCDNEFVDFRK
jgi:Putative MetA-pathway of phenol degradation